MATRPDTVTELVVDLRSGEEKGLKERFATICPEIRDRVPREAVDRGPRTSADGFAPEVSLKLTDRGEPF